MFENPRSGRQARNFTTNVRKILDQKIVFRKDIFQKLTLGAPDLRAGTATKLRETSKLQLKTWKEVINDTTDTKGEVDGQTWRRLKRIEVVVFGNLLA